MKFYGAIGYVASAETPPGSGVWEDVATERMLYGDVLKNTRALREGDKVNNDRSIGNRFSLVADPYALENFWAIKYIMWSGVRFIVTNVDVEPPRLILTPGGIYNGPTPAASGSS